MHNAAPLQSAASYIEDIIAVGNSFCSKYVKDFLSVKNISIAYYIKFICMYLIRIMYPC